MKKIITLLFVAIMSVSLVACAGSPASNEGKTDETKIVLTGEWSCKNDGSVLTFNEDATGSIAINGRTIEFTWVFDEPSRSLLLDANGDYEMGTYLEVNDTIYADGYVYTRVEK